MGTPQSHAQKLRLPPILSGRPISMLLVREREREAHSLGTVYSQMTQGFRRP